MRRGGDRDRLDQPLGGVRVTCHRRAPAAYGVGEGAWVAEEPGEGCGVCLDDRVRVTGLAVFHLDLAVSDACCEAVGADVQVASRLPAGVVARVEKSAEAEHGGISAERPLGRQAW